MIKRDAGLAFVLKLKKKDGIILIADEISKHFKSDIIILLFSVIAIAIDRGDFPI